MLQHVGIEVRREDAERAAELFELLGFERVTPPPDLAAGFTWVEREGTQIHIMHEDLPSAPRRGHLAVVVPDYEAALERLREHGFRPEPRAEHWGAPRAQVEAPGGHRVELMAAPPTGDY